MILEHLSSNGTNWSKPAFHLSRLKIGLVYARSPSGILTIRSESHRLGGSEIRELKDGRFGYILRVFIRSDSPGKTIIRDSWISPPWADPTFEWLEDPKELGQHPAWYAFPRDTEQFARVEVINHRVRCVLSRGDIREGLLLGIGCGRPPDIYKTQRQGPSRPHHAGPMGFRAFRDVGNADESARRSRQGNLRAPDGPGLRSRMSRKAACLASLPGQLVHPFDRGHRSVPRGAKTCWTRQPQISYTMIKRGRNSPGTSTAGCT